MSDHTLSSLRRRARQTGSVEDLAAVLVARLRSAPACERCGGTGGVADPRDDLPPRVLSGRGQPCPSCAGTGSPLRARVELAAWCGDGAARGALGSAGEDCRDCGGTGNDHHACCDPECCPEGPGDECGTCGGRGAVAPEPPALAVWLSGLSRWADVGPAPRWVLVRSAVAAAREVARHQNLAVWARIQTPDPGDAMGPACREEARAELRAIEAAEAWLDDPTNDARWTAWHASYVEAGHLAWLPVPTRASETGARARDAILSATFAGEQPVREAICRSLVEWALSEDA